MKDLTSQYRAGNECTDNNRQTDGNRISQQKSAREKCEDIPPRAFQCIRDATEQEHPAEECNASRDW